MADTTKKTDNATKGKTATIRLPRANGRNAVQEEFFSVNGRNYLLKRGETIEVPEEVAEVIINSERAEEFALNYVDNLSKTESNKQKDMGIN